MLNQCKLGEGRLTRFCQSREGAYTRRGALAREDTGICEDDVVLYLGYFFV